MQRKLQVDVSSWHENSGQPPRCRMALERGLLVVETLCDAAYGMVGEYQHGAAGQKNAYAFLQLDDKACYDIMLPLIQKE